MRRRKPEQSTVWPVPPPELIDPQIQDWITAEDISSLRQHLRLTHCTPPRTLEQLVADALPIRARRNWDRARRDWLAEHNVPAGVASEVLPYRRPRPAETSQSTNPQLRPEAPR